MNRSAEREVDLYALLMKLRAGGAIVSSAECSPTELAFARSEGRVFVDKDGFGYVYRAREKKA